MILNRTEFEKELDEVLVASLGGAHEGGFLELVLGVDVLRSIRGGEAVDEEVDGVEVAAVDCKENAGAAGLLGLDREGVGGLLVLGNAHQSFADGGATEFRGEHEGVKAGAGEVVQLGTFLGKASDDIDVTHGGGPHDGGLVVN